MNMSVREFPSLTVCRSSVGATSFHSAAPTGMSWRLFFVWGRRKLVHQPTAKALHTLPHTTTGQRFKQTKLCIGTQHRIQRPHQRTAVEVVVDQVGPGQRNALPVDS